MIIGFTGRKRSGKSTAARHLVEHYGFVELSFAQALKDMALSINPIIDFVYVGTFKGKPQFRPIYLADAVNRYGWERVKDRAPEARRFLQRLGTEGVRDHIGVDTWVDKVDRQIRAIAGRRSIVIADVRFENEAELVRIYGGIVVEVTRGENPPPPEHSSEAGVTADFEIVHPEGDTDALIKGIDDVVERLNL